MASNCLNCGEPIAQNFCPACGQGVEDRRRSVLSLLGEFFGEFFAVDGRFVQTLRRLVIPGRLTQLYLEGKRASYVPPARVYVVASLIFFFFAGIPTPNAENFNVYVDDMLIGRDEPVEGLGNLQLSGLDKRSWVSNQIEPLILPKLDSLQTMKAQDLLDRFFGRLQRLFPTALIFFVPVLAFALKLLYVRQPFFYVDHLVFALHFQSFLFLLLVLAHYVNVAGLDRLVHPLVTHVAALFLCTPPYLLLALRRVYRQGWGRTTLKTGLLGLLYLLLIQPIMIVTFLLVIRQM